MNDVQVAPALEQEVGRIHSALKRNVEDVSGVPYKQSEIDTQVIGVEPVLGLIGWDLSDLRQVRRSDRNPRSWRQRFDVELHEGRIIRAVIEVKSRDTPEFNVVFGSPTMTVVRGDGSVKVEGMIHIPKKGDGVGQLRGYCLNLRSQLSQKIDFGRIHPVLTNGLYWVVFRPDRFFDPNDLRRPITIADVVEVDGAPAAGRLDAALLERLRRLIGFSSVAESANLENAASEIG